MSLPPGFDFIKPLGPKFAKAVQGLTLEDLKAMNISCPARFADPDDPGMVKVQRRKLREHSERYCGVVYNGELVALLKLAPWLGLDASPFATGLDALRLLKCRVRRQNAFPDHPLGIFALVVSNKLDKDVAGRSVFVFLLEHALEMANGRAVNIIVPAKNRPEWLIVTLERYRFVRVGRRGKAAGLPALKQVCYRRPASPS